MLKQFNLLYAMKNGELVHISDVESGLKCGCICPACGAQLIARKGTKVMHHFAHYNTEECQYGYETSLHLAAKNIIAEAQKILLPSVYLNFDSGRQKLLIVDATEVKIEEVKLEKGIDDIIPDIIVKSGGKEFIIEIFVTHAIDDIKLKKIEAKNISTLEINLSKKESTIDEKELKEILLGTSELKIWKYNALEQVWKQKFLNVTEKKIIISRGYALHVENCPIAVRVWKGKPYANFIDDCTGCQFFISEETKKYEDEDDNGAIYCSGKNRIATIEDFNQSKEERIKNYNSEDSQQKDEDICNGKCPNCGSELVQRNSKYGQFWGCSNFPHCRFTMNIDPNTGEIITKS